MFGMGAAELSQERFGTGLTMSSSVPSLVSAPPCSPQNREILGLQPFAPMPFDQDKRWQPRATNSGPTDRLYEYAQRSQGMTTGRSSILGQAD